MDNDSDKKKSTLGNLLLSGGLLHLGAGAAGGSIYTDIFNKAKGLTGTQRLIAAAIPSLLSAGALGLGYNRLKKALNDGDENAENGKASKLGTGVAGTMFVGLGALSGERGLRVDRCLRIGGASGKERLAMALAHGIPALGAFWAASRMKDRYNNISEQER